MNGREHKVAGACAGIAACIILNRYQANSTIQVDTLYVSALSAATIVTSVASSLLPDVDTPNSTVGSKVKPISYLINKTGGHRGILHYPIFLAIICGLLYYLYPTIPDGLERDLYLYVSTGFVVGYLSHIILDMFNSAGIKLLAPFIGFKFKIPTGLSFWKKGKLISFKYLKGDKIADRCIANFISISALAIFALYFYGFLKF